MVTSALIPISIGNQYCKVGFGEIIEPTFASIIDLSISYLDDIVSIIPNLFCYPLTLSEYICQWPNNAHKKLGSFTQKMHS